MDEGIVKAENSEGNSQIDVRKTEIAHQTASLAFTPKSTDIEVNLDKAAKITLNDIAAFGTGLTGLLSSTKTITQTVSVAGGVLLKAFDASGNPIDISALHKAKDASGMLGSIHDAAGKLGQARFKEAGDLTATVTAKAPVDPMQVFIAAALMEVNQKLDAIQETQKEMFEYIKNKDKAEQRGNLETLADITNNYCYNWDNDQYKKNKHILVQTIKGDAEKAIIQHRAEVRGQLAKKGFVTLHKDVKEKAVAVKSELDEYRLAVYLYSFSSFVEVMLLENYDQNYLQGIIDKIERYALEYRMLYTDAYNAIEAEEDQSVEAFALGGLSKAAQYLGKAVEKSPVGDRIQIDEMLIGAGKGLGKFKRDSKDQMMGMLVDAKSSDVRPFIEGIGNVSKLYNEPVLLLADSEAVYLLPADELDDECDE